MREREEILDLIEELNRESFLDGVSFEYYSPFEFKSNGDEYAVFFMGIILWTEENDEREWIDEENKEPFRGYFIRESKKLLHDLNMRVAQL